MENPKILAYRYNNELSGTEMIKQEVELIDSKTEDRVATYIVKTEDGIYCTAIFNPFTCCYYADDVHGVIENYRPKRDMEM